MLFTLMQWAILQLIALCFLNVSLTSAGGPGWLLSPSTLPRSTGSATSARGCKPPGGASAGCWTSAAPAPSGATQYRGPGWKMFGRQTISLICFLFRILSVYNLYGGSAAVTTCYYHADSIITNKRITWLHFLISQRPSMDSHVKTTACRLIAFWCSFL